MMERYQTLSKFAVPSGFRGRGAIQVQLWWLVQGSAFRWSPQFMYGFRRFLLRLFGAKVGRGVLIRPSATFTYPWKVDIGDFAWVGDDVVIYSLGNISIGAHSVVSQRSYICAGTHDPTLEAFDILSSPVVIEEQVWIATDVFVSPGVTIGEGAVVGARSTVLKDLPAGYVCVGYPCVPIRSRKNTPDPSPSSP